jgi:putative transferase (TIGR04331 family)
MVFLGEWCRRYDRSPAWKSLQAVCLQNNLYEGKNPEDVNRHLNDIYEQSLAALTDVLNAIHREQHQERYWRIVIGPWLRLYTTAVYHKYISVLSAIKQYPDSTSIALAKDDFIVPRDTYEAERLMTEDVYNLQLYTRMFLALGIEHPHKNAGNLRSMAEYADRSIYTKSKNLKMAEWVSGIVHGVYGKKEPVALVNAYFPGTGIIHLIVSTRGRVCLGEIERIELPLFSIDQRKRNEIGNVQIANDEFLSMLPGMISSDMPHCFVEGFEAVAAVAERAFPGKPKAIFSANSWYYDEPFKQWAASSAEGGSLLLGTQHGGNYGSIKYHPALDHELRITDRYYSWGWERTECYSKVIPMPSTKLSGRRRLGAENRQKRILFLSTSFPRYFHGVSPRQVNFSEYIQWRFRFAEGLTPSVRVNIHVRPHRDDYGWGSTERWQDRFPDTIIEKWDVPFWESLGNCRIVVCDYISTTFIEALAADKPTVLFWDPEVEVVREEAKPYYDALRTVGILHDTPERAATTINSVFEDVASWWNEPRRREGLRYFCQRFALAHVHPIRDWIAEFQRVLR